MPIITSLLDTDLYTFSVMQLALRKFSSTEAKYTFKCRNKANWSEEKLNTIISEVNSFCELQFTEKELDYLSNIRFFKKDFIDFLSLYKPNMKHFHAWIENDELNITVKGPWYLTIPFEVPILAIVNEVYFKNTDTENGMERLEEKMIKLAKYGFPFADFGTRRRYNKTWHNYVVKNLSRLYNFVGTSNVKLAMDYNVKPIGTMSHQLIMIGAGQEDVPLVKSQQRMLQAWADEYRGDLGIALSDTYGIKAFLRDFDLYFAKLYDGLRHDSGDPIEWGELVIKHYEKLGIDPKTKSLVFSDGLNVDKANEIYQHFKDRITVSFGIGTNFTNDFSNITPLNIVMKLTEVNGRPVAKISDSPGKTMCNDEHFLTYLKDVYKIER